ncbi:MAG: hypothetical protein IKU37_08415 [Candidatus Gastranaerophilales bacterium]|nr:hypothetical protein [Candidatus Gastranaerophilales bacterium]
MEFNSVNFNLNNIANQKAGLVNNSQNLLQQTQSQIQPQIQQAASLRVEHNFMYDFFAAKMDNETVLRYLQKLFDFPDSIEKFVNQLNDKNINSKLVKILVENLVNVKALSELINQNSTEAISRIMQAISSSLKSGIDAAQLKEVLVFLNAIQANTSHGANALREFLLLYIPLNVPVFDKNLNNETLEEHEAEAIKKSKLSILIETINFSNLLICINEFENNFYVDVFSLKTFLKDEFLRIINVLLKEATIYATFDFKEIKTSHTAIGVQNFKIVSDGYLSSNMLILAHMLIKGILKIDNEYIDK